MILFVVMFGARFIRQNSSGIPLHLLRLAFTRLLESCSPPLFLGILSCFYLKKNGHHHVAVIVIHYYSSGSAFRGRLRAIRAIHSYLWT